MRPFFLPLGFVVVGCASGPIDLAGAKVVDVKVFAYSEKPGPTSPTNVDLSKEDKVPCEANELRVAVEVRAVRAGQSKTEVFSSGGGLKDRIKENPAAYKDLGIEDPVAYEESHTFDLREFDFQVSKSVTMDRIGTTGSGGMYSSSGDKLDFEEVVLRLDQKRGRAEGFEIVATPKFAADKKVTKTWQANRGCDTKTLIAGAAGDLNHRHGDPGPRVTVYVTKANGPNGEVMLAFIDHAKGQKWVVADLGTPHTFVAAGGNGVEGTNTEPGGDGGKGGTIQVLFDHRYPELEQNVAWEASGGRGGRGTTDGRNGAAGEGTVKKSDDVIKILAKRGDLPAGVTLIDPPKDPKAPAPPKKK